MDVSEDCLYMNIYVPALDARANNFTVMVYIHGGGFYTKSANLHDGARMSTQGQVIVILLNYRLGMFGFLSTEDNSSPGNYGLWDQIEALKWINANIHYFGGNPSRVTLFGHSAGGYSIGLLLVSKHAYGLFQRAIAMSGLGVNRRAVTHDARDAAFRVARSSGCYNSSEEYNSESLNSTYLVTCLRGKTSQEIMMATKEMRSSYNEYDFIMRPGPVIDHDLLSRSPESLLLDRKSDGFRTFVSVDVMAGTNDEDGWLLRSKLDNMQNTYHFDLDDGVPYVAMCDGVVTDVVRDYYKASSTIASKICQMYKGNSSSIDQGRLTLDMYGDMFYASPTVQTLRAHRLGLKRSGNANQRQTYHFLFTHKPNFPVITSRRKWLNGAQHGDETWFIFRNKNFGYSTEEERLNEEFVRYLTNFAKTGYVLPFCYKIPPLKSIHVDVSNLLLKFMYALRLTICRNPNSETTEIYWPAFDLESERYLEININSTVRQHLYRNRMSFWLEEVVALAQSMTSSSESIHQYLMSISDIFVFLYILVITL